MERTEGSRWRDADAVRTELQSRRRAGCQPPLPARSRGFGASRTPGTLFPTPFLLNTLPGSQLLQGDLNQPVVLVFVCLFKMRNKKQNLPWSEGVGGVLSLRVGGKSTSSLGNIYIFLARWIVELASPL